MDNTRPEASVLCISLTWSDVCSLLQAETQSACAGWLAELAASADPSSLMETSPTSDAEHSEPEHRPRVRDSDTDSSDEAAEPTVRGSASLAAALEDAFAGACMTRA